MLKFICFIWFLLSCQTVFGQILAFTVSNDLDENVSACSIYKNSNFIGQSSEYVYYLKCALSDTIQIKKDGLYSSEFIIQSNNDTIYHTFILIPKIQEVDAVSVTNQQKKTLAGDLNDNLIDFLYFPDKKAFVVLKSNKGAFYLEQKTDLTSRNYLLNFKPQSLFLDIFGNTHIITKDSTYQIWIDDTMKFISVLPKQLFDNKIKQLIHKNAEFVFYENFSEHNQCYVLSKTDQSNNVFVVSKSFDKVAFHVAKDEYNEVIKLYNQQTTPLNNIITNGTWDGQLESLGENSEILNQIIWYKNVRAKPIDCHSFGMMNEIVFIDFFNQQIEKYALNGESIAVIQLEKIKFKNKKLIYDYFYDAIYTVGKVNDQLNIYKINLEDGSLKNVGNLNGIESENIKVIGNDVFYLARNNAGYRKLYKLSINQEN